MANLLRSTNYRVRKGFFRSPEFAVPTQYNYFKLRMSRDNWPSPGVLIGVEASRDNGVTWKIVREQFIQPFVATPKQPTIIDAVIDYGWNPAEMAHAGLVRAFSDSPLQFNSVLTLEANIFVGP